MANRVAYFVEEQECWRLLEACSDKRRPGGESACKREKEEDDGSGSHHQRRDPAGQACNG